MYHQLRMTETDSLHQTGSKSIETWARITDLGVIKQTREWYSFLKSSNALFLSGTSLLESGLQRVVDPVSHLAKDFSQNHPTTVERLDHAGVECINTIEHGVDKARSMTTSISTFSLQKQMATLAIGCLDTMITASENVIDYMSSDVRLVPHRSMSKDGSTQTTEDEGDGVDGHRGGARPKAVKHVHIPESALINKFEEQKRLGYAARDVMTTPVKYLAESVNFGLTILKSKYVTSSKSTSTHPSLRKPKGRRKVKPTAIKRSKTGQRVVRRTLTFLVKITGLKAFAEFITKISANEVDEIFREASKDKRKHSDIESSASESDLDPLNLDGYDSGEDKDWQPSNKDLQSMKRALDDSLEYQSDHDDSYVDIQENGVDAAMEVTETTQASPTDVKERTPAKQPTSPTKATQTPGRKDSAAKKGNEMSAKTCEVISKKSGIPLKSENKENTKPPAVPGTSV